MPDDLSDRQSTRVILIVAAFFLILMAAYFFLREQTAESVQTDLPPSPPAAGSSEDAGRQSQDSTSQEDVPPQDVAGSDGVVPDIAAPDMRAPLDVAQTDGVAQERVQPDDVPPDDFLRDHASLDNTALDIAARDSISQDVARPEDRAASRLEDIETGQSRVGQSEGQKQVPDANARRQTGADNASTQPVASMPVPSEDSSTSEQDVQADSMQVEPVTGGAHKESHDDVFAQADKLLQEAESLSGDITSGRNRVHDSSGLGDSGSNQIATLPDRVDETVQSPSGTVLPQAESRLSQVDSGRDQEPSSDKVQVTPEFDIVRVDPNGTAVISGRAAPNSTVQVIVNGEEKYRVRVDDTGEFAIILDLDTESSALEITLRAETDDGQIIVSEQSVLVLQTNPVPTAGLPEDELPPVAAGPETMSAEGIQPTVLLSSSTGVSLLQQEFPLLDQETLVESVSYDETGEAILGGRASNLDSIVRIYLDNQFIKDADVRADMTWSTSLREILPGRYALRIDEISSRGQVVGRVEMPFQKEDKDFIAAMLESVSQAANAPPGIDTDVQLPQLVTVQRGYTLWGISRSRYGLGRLYVNIFNLNQDQIRDPDLIYPGQVFRMPGEDNLFDPEYGRQFVPAQ